MIRARRMCKTCPFRGASEEYRRACAHIQPQDWPCHTEDLHGDSGIQCRGHFEAIRKYGHEIGPSATELDLTIGRREDGMRFG